MRTVRDDFGASLMRWMAITLTAGLLAAGLSACSDDDGGKNDAGGDRDAAADGSGGGDGSRSDRGTTDGPVGTDSGGPCTLDDGADGLRCGTECVDISSDPEHCGGCGRAVGVGGVCVGGKERAGCPRGQGLCGSQCVDITTDPANCGSCGNACAATQTCEVISGTPQCSCPLDGSDFVGDDLVLKPADQRRYRDCRAGGDAANCVDTWSSAAHCGVCSKACTGVLSFCGRNTDGPTPVTECISDCSSLAGFSACGKACVDLQNDPFNCGSCGTRCGLNEVCDGGNCRCSGESTECDGRCVNFAEDVLNCGGCVADGEGQVCGGLEICIEATALRTCGCPGGRNKCGGNSCTNLETDNDNCGDCGNRCENNTRCLGGVCTCPEGLSNFAGRCTDINSDPFNCGGEGIVCAANQRCLAGKCQSNACSSETRECVFSSEDQNRGGCVNTSIDVNHCGACGTTCAQNETCTGGQCVCANGGTKCGDDCVDLQTDARHCGGCGSSCARGQVCVAGKCEASCPAGRSLCEGKCVDLLTDIDHCGSCGNTCDTGGGGPGTRCVAGACSDFETAPACTGENRQQCYRNKCVDVSTDEKNCGGCGVVCSASQTCGANPQAGEEGEPDFICTNND